MADQETDYWTSFNKLAIEQMVTERQILGKYTFWWRVRVIIFAPFWYLTPRDKRKPWGEFKNGLVKHKCDYGNNIEMIQGHPFRKCKHFGCNTYDPVENPIPKLCSLF